MSSWVEGVSAEDLTHKNIINLWAEILARSPEAFDSKYAAAIDIFKKIGAEEAELLSALRSWFDPQEGFFQHHRIANENEKTLRQYLILNELPHTDDFSGSESKDKLREFENKMPRLHVSFIETISVYAAKQGMYRKFVKSKKSDVVNILIKEGILERKDISQKLAFSTLTLTYIQITDFGMTILDIIFPKDHPVRVDPRLQEWALM